MQRPLDCRHGAPAAPRSERGLIDRLFRIAHAFPVIARRAHSLRDATVLLCNILVILVRHASIYHSSHERNTRHSMEDVFRMMRTRHCYLHIGTHKTGTSSVQDSLTRAPQQLEEAGFYFPRTGQWESGSGQHGLAVQARSNAHDALVEALIREIETIPHHIILSSEEFSHMLWRNTAGFQHLVDRLSGIADKITVILYLRRQPDFIESNYLERLKSRFHLGFSTYAHARMHHDLAEFPLDYRKLIERLDHVRGIRIEVRAYDSASKPGILQDFLGVIGWPSNVPLAESRINGSLPLVESLKNFCRAQEQRELTESEERLIELISLSLPPRPRMNGRTRRALVQRYAESNRELAERFGLPSLMETPESNDPLDADVELAIDDTLAAMPDANGATLDHLFSSVFLDIVRSVAERFGATQAALAQTQLLALERYAEIEALRARLGRAEAELNALRCASLRTE
ncbi:hypothetical protein [Burkholderia savannae]|uniref:hypothetical protein n=1 Tax=Burkholderia savannae TaxID=1637837 RepID=UPI000A8ED327|nr:hypothetical protein [Burkholderia savannae]